MSAPARTWVRVLCGLAAVVLAGCGTEPPLGTPAPSPLPTAVVPTPAPTPSPTAAPTSPPPSPSASPSATASPSASATAAPRPQHRPTALREGDRGPAVLALQQRLSALGYWLGTPDGRFGDLTEQAVYALQKAARLTRDGRVGPRTAKALAEGARPRAHSTAGHVVEVDLAHQLVLVVDDGRVSLVLNTSTGSGRYYWYQGRRHLAVTPRGHFAVYAEIDGLRISPLGRLWRPKYFHGGIALHGSLFVPPWPDSHGCVRLSDPAIDMLWATGLAPIGTPVWVV
jgi:hypothetical protein